MIRRRRFRRRMEAVLLAIVVILPVYLAIALAVVWPTMLLIGILSRPISALPPLGLVHTYALLLLVHLLTSGHSRMKESA